MLKMEVIFFGYPSGYLLVFFLICSCGAVKKNEFCFDAQLQDIVLTVKSGKRLVTAFYMKTITDTTAVTHSFHLDYIHPKTNKWTTYQENRNSKMFSFPSPEEKKPTKFVIQSPFIGEILRVSLKFTDYLGWLGKLCMEIDFKVKKPKAKDSCRAGYYGDGKYCLDINECADTTGNFCRRKQRCVDFPGSFSCPGKCIEDKVINKKTGACEELCFNNGYICHEKAECQNGVCICKRGYDGDGFYCLDKCIMKGLSCDINADCDNSKCTCRQGYRGNGEICQAVCYFGTTLCHPNAVCLENICRCKPGYVGDGLSKCVFSRVRYEKSTKEGFNAKSYRMDIIETDVFEVLHNFHRLRTVLNEKDNKPSGV